MCYFYWVFPQQKLKERVGPLDDEGASPTGRCVGRLGFVDGFFGPGVVVVPSTMLM